MQLSTLFRFFFTLGRAVIVAQPPWLTDDEFFTADHRPVMLIACSAPVDVNAMVDSVNLIARAERLYLEARLEPFQPQADTRP